VSDLEMGENPWLICLLGSRTLVGLRVEADPRQITLSPVYEIQTQIGMGPNGAPVQVTALQPVGGFLSIKEVKLPAPPVSVIVPVTDLDRVEQAWIHAQVKDVQDRIRKEMASRAGITIAGAGTKLPPIEKLIKGS
jgi:hypothetical protein